MCLLSVSVYIFHVGFPLTFRCDMARWLSQDEAKGLQSSMVSRHREPGHRRRTRQTGNRAGKSEAGTVSRPTAMKTGALWSNGRAMAARQSGQFKRSGVGGRLIITLAVNI